MVIPLRAAQQPSAGITWCNAVVRFDLLPSVLGVFGVAAHAAKLQRMLVGQLGAGRADLQFTW